MLAEDDFSMTHSMTCSPPRVRRRRGGGDGDCWRRGGSAELCDMVSDPEPALIPDVAKSPAVRQSRNFDTNSVNGNCTGRFGVVKTIQLFCFSHCYLKERLQEN
jgi:hypothetical protein